MRSVTATNFRELVSNNEHRDETTKDTTWSRKQTATKISVIASELSGRISVSGGTSVGGKGIFNQNTVTQADTSNMVAYAVDRRSLSMTQSSTTPKIIAFW